MDMTDIVIHVRPGLSAPERGPLEGELRGLPGMISIHFSPARPHLLTAVYDADVTSATRILARLGERGVAAAKGG